MRTPSEKHTFSFIATKNPINKKDRMNLKEINTRNYFLLVEPRKLEARVDAEIIAHGWMSVMP